MSAADDLVLVRGLRDSRATLERWAADPLPVVARWVAWAFAVACGLLLAVWVIASLAPVDITTLYVTGVYDGADLEDIGRVLFRNSLVLALHAFACVAGFIAGSSLAIAAEHRSGISRWIHEQARPIALGWVVIVTCFSLVTQAYALGLTGAQLSNQLAISPGALVLTVLPHAIPELVAVFLPLAAWLVASRRNQWEDLLAATFVTVTIAIPILICAATWESYMWPRILEAVSPMI